MRGRRVGIVMAAVALGLGAGCGDDDGAGTTPDGVEIGGSGGVARGPEAWPAPPADQVKALTEEAGEHLELKESLIHHVHAHLDVYIDGEHRQVPPAIGIVTSDPGVRRFDGLEGTSFGGIEQCDEPCISPLHTHDNTGVIHTESATDEDHTLGQLFVEWDVRLTDECIGDHCAPDTAIAVYVDGDEVPLAEAADVVLTNGKEIAIVIGDPPDRIPSEADLSEA